MSDLITLIFALIVDLFRSRAALEAEVIALRQQILVLRRGRLARLPFLVTDRLVLGWLCWLFPHARDALAVVRPENRSALAPSGLPIVLALEVETATGSSRHVCGDPPFGPFDERCQPVVGCTCRSAGAAANPVRVRDQSQDR